MAAWQTFWLWTYVLGLGAFALLAVVLIPLGLRDLVRMFRHLREQGEERE